MNKIAKLLIASALIANLSCSNSFSQVLPPAKQSSNTVLNLQAVVDYTMSKNFDVDIAKCDVQEAKGQYIRSYAMLMPSLRAQLSGENFHGGEVIYFAQPVSLDRVTYRPTLSADYQIYTGGKPFFEIGVYKNKYLQAQKAYDDATQKSLYEALSKYYDWLRTYAAYKTTEQSLKEAQTELRINNDRFVSGFGTELEITEAKALVTERKNQLLQAKNKQETSRIELKAVLNVPFSQDVSAEKPTIEPIEFVQEDITLPQLYENAIKNRPDVKALDYAIRAAKNELKSARSDIMPVINLSGYVRGIGPEMSDLTRTTQGAISLNVDLLRYMGVNVYGNIQEVKARLNKAILQKEKLLNDIYGQIGQCYYDYQLYKDQLDVAQEKIDAAQKQYKITQAKEEAGDASKLDILKAQSVLTQAQLEYQTAAMNNNVSQLALLYKVGGLTPDVVVNNKQTNSKISMSTK